MAIDVSQFRRESLPVSASACYSTLTNSASTLTSPTCWTRSPFEQVFLRRSGFGLQCGMRCTGPGSPSAASLLPTDTRRTPPALDFPDNLVSGEWVELLPDVLFLVWVDGLVARGVKDEECEKAGARLVEEVPTAARKLEFKIVVFYHDLNNKRYSVS